MVRQCSGSSICVGCAKSIYIFFCIVEMQLKEMGGSSRPSESYKPNDQVPERKKGFAEWVNIIKPPNEEKDHWVIICPYF